MCNDCCMNRYLIIFIFSWLSLLFSTTAISNCPAPVRLSHEDAGNGCITLHWELPLANKMLITNPLQPTRGSQPPYDTVKAIGTKLFTPVATKTTTNADVLFDQSELITYKGIGYNGADVSSLYGNMTSLGANANHKNGYWVADDFTLTANTVIDEIDVYAYQSFYIGEKPPIKKCSCRFTTVRRAMAALLFGAATPPMCRLLLSFRAFTEWEPMLRHATAPSIKATAHTHHFTGRHLLGSRVVFGRCFCKYLGTATNSAQRHQHRQCLAHGTEGWQPWIDAGAPAQWVCR